MEIIPGIGAIPHDMGDTVVTVGMFDGVHRGHQKIIHIAHEKARVLGLRCVVFTFDRHPLEVLNAGNHPRLLSSSAQKLRLLEELDVDMVLMAHFDEEFSHISARRFAEELLAGRLRAREVVLGENFHFGKGGEGDVSFLQGLAGSLAITVTPVALLRDNGDVISSTLIRKMIEHGEVEEAIERLGWDYMIEGMVVRGDARGRGMGFPTANIEVHDNRCIPANGVYAGEVYLEHRILPAVSYIGDIPTFAGGEEVRRRIEVHIPGWEEDLYDHFMGISFQRRLRGEETFPDARALIEQIEQDVKRALER
ncbi:MAG: bifunctional riboflavin kinase/FAD synthetase [Actinobacteria bacterium]|jgi:riboflavin kinase/FMN adenylyltransferase|nr:MAG: bifunctional riboflavin kinase/FAD synthetase [Actinomycetota bacterium]